MTQDDVTIIVPHYGASKEMEYAFDQTMQSIKETFDGSVIVIKNGPPCDHAASLRTEPQGQCRAVNVGATIPTTPWLLITNDDMIYPPGWFEKLTDGLPDEVLCVSPKLVEPHPGAPTFETYFCGGAGGDFDKEKFLAFASNYNGAGLRTGFNTPFLIRRDLWETIEGYDEAYDPWGSNSDSDLLYKIKLAGVQPMQNTNCIVYHFSQTSGTFHPDNRSFWSKNWEYFIEKWGVQRLDSPEIWTADFEVPIVRFKPKWIGKYANT